MTLPRSGGSLHGVFGSLGGPEVILIFILALLLFGPRKLPEIGRMLGKAAGEFRKATQDFRVSLEREVELDKVKNAAQSIATELRPTFSRGALLDGLTGGSAAQEPPPAEPPRDDSASAPHPAPPAADVGNRSDH